MLHGLASDYAEQATKRNISERNVTDFGSSTFNCVNWRKKADHQPPDERIQTNTLIPESISFLNGIATAGLFRLSFAICSESLFSIEIQMVQNLP